MLSGGFICSVSVFNSAQPSQIGGYASLDLRQAQGFISAAAQQGA